MPSSPTPPDHGPLGGSVTAVLQEAVEQSLPHEELVERLMPVVYDELRQIARYQRRQIVSDFQTTALVHEAYLRLAGHPLVPERAYVFAAAAQAMRRVLVDHARRRGAVKRGSGQADLSLEDLHVPVDSANLDDLAARVLDVDTALQRLEAISPRTAQLVNCRFFAGLSNEEAAAALGISPSSAKREWRRARAWLHKALADNTERDGPSPSASAQEGDTPPL